MEQIEADRQDNPLAGRDGMECLAEHQIEYRGIQFTVHLERYFTVSPVNIDAEMSSWGNLFIEITCDSELAERIRTYGWPMKDWFLQIDTAHGANEGQDVEEKLEWALERAKQHIDWLHERMAEETREHLQEQEDELEQILELAGVTRKSENGGGADAE